MNMPDVALTVLDRVQDGQEIPLLTIDPEGQITAFSGKVEYGQGIRSSFAIMVAEELDVSAGDISVVMGRTDEVPYDRGTTGSRSTHTIGTRLRQAAATARHAFISLAAENWDVPAAGLATRDGRVLDNGENGAFVRYADLLKDRDIRVLLDEGVTTKRPEAFQVIGRPAGRTDATAIVTGAARYSRDVSVPGMLHGKVVRPPSLGARLEQADTTRAERMPGVVAAVRDGDFLGVVAEREDTAERAIAAVRARWQEDRPATSDWNLPALLQEKASEPDVLRAEGSPEEALEQADHVHEGTYYVPYVSIAAMEPSAAVAAWTDDRVAVWSGNRSPFGVRERVATALEIAPERVRVITPEIGGSFGTKSTDQAAVEAARLSRAAGRPVRVVYSRAEEFAWSTVRPAALIEIRSGTMGDGRMVAWEYRATHARSGSTFRGQRGADTLYDIPNVKVSVSDADSPLWSGSYRSLGGAVNHFGREVHMDEIAVKLGLDPVEFRLRNLQHARLRRVLTAATERFGWESRRSEPGLGFGVAVGYDAGSYAAQCAEVEVAGRDVTVKRVVCAFDCGLVINPDGVANQVEGSIMMGTGTALWEAVEFDGGRVLNPAFSTYRVPRITDTPAIEVVLVGDQTEPPTGAGEPAIVPIAAAICNAVYDATGCRIPELPIVPRLS